MQCGQSLAGLRSDAVFCRQRCKRRYYRRADRSNYTEPPRPGNSIAQDRADREWRRQFAAEGIRAEPLTPQEEQAVALQKRNQGPMVPFFRQRFLAKADDELRAREAAFRDSRAIKVEDPYNPATIGSVAARGRASRALNKPVDPYVAMLRPGPESGHSPYADEAECIDAPVGWRRGRY
jgi:hypothetical protein